MQYILTINTGSSSLKCALFAVDQPDLARPSAPRWAAQASWSREAGTAKLVLQGGSEETVDALSPGDILALLLPKLWEGKDAPLSAPDDVAVVGHRVVHGGTDLITPTIITAAIRQQIADLAEFAPLHNPLAVASIDAVTKALPAVRQAAVFDTAFHQTLPPESAIYPGPYRWYERGIRRYGFHGINVAYCMARAQVLPGGEALRAVIVCHLGNGASLTAVKDGASMATTMGFTPLDGLMMGTRSGSVDPGILLYLLRHGESVDDLDQTLNHQSGLLGISGTSSDMQALHQAIARGDQRAALAYTLYIAHLKGEIARMAAALGGLDSLIFTGGIGEHDADLRAETVAGLAFLGIAIDRQRNTSVQEGAITAEGTKIQTLVIPANEAWAIASACAKLGSSVGWHSIR